MDLLKERCNFVQKKGQKYVELIVTCDDPELSDNEDEDEYTNLPSVFLELWCVCSYPLYVVTPFGAWIATALHFTADWVSSLFWREFNPDSFRLRRYICYSTSF